MYKTIIVIDDGELQVEDEYLSIITFETYLNEYPKKNEPKTRIINLCNTEHYLSRGYYCSLLAEARQHKVIPSVSTINDLRHQDRQLTSNKIPSELMRLIDDGQSVELYSFFGWVEQQEWKRTIRSIFELLPAPILRVTLTRNHNAIQQKIERLSLGQLDEKRHLIFIERLQNFTHQVWRRASSQKHLRWDMAILVDPEEKHPPSDKEAIKRFVKAAAKVGINAEVITAAEASQINQFDALFIRETTAIDHHTYQLARRAEQEGLVVIDDPTSILRCCNKVFLHDAFSYKGVPSLKTRIAITASPSGLDELEHNFEYPMVLKVPEGSFSKGVFKVNDRSELQAKLETILTDTSLVLVQEYLYTDFDWRVGVLNGRAIYACRYHMARNHWQIYNHDVKRNSSGGFESLPTFEVPRSVLGAAIKAANMIGKGLYGVDLKQKEKQVFVIEVNDNPSIDYKVEDSYLGNELYMLIMSEFAQRLERRGR